MTVLLFQFPFWKSLFIITGSTTK